MQTNASRAMACVLTGAGMMFAHGWEKNNANRQITPSVRLPSRRLNQPLCVEHHAVEPCDGKETVGGRRSPYKVDAPFAHEPYRTQGDGPGQQPLGLSAGRFDQPWPEEVELLLDADAPVVHDGPDAGRDDERYVGTEEEIVPYIRVVPSMGDSQGDSHVGIVDGPYSQYPSHIEFGDADGLASLLFVEQQVGNKETADDEEHGHPVGHH